MDELVAIRVDEQPGKKRVHGYVSRGPNRKRVWSIDITDLSDTEARAMIAEFEATRKATNKP